MSSDNNLQNINLSSVYSSSDVENFGEVSGKDILGFAKSILWYLFVLVLFVFAMSYLMAYQAPKNTQLTSVVNSILDITKTAVPSIVSLVMGFYFGKREQNSDAKPL